MHWKNLHISGPTHSKPVLFKGHLYLTVSGINGRVVLKVGRELSIGALPPC